MKKFQVISPDASYESFEDFVLCVFDCAYWVSEGCDRHFATFASSTRIVCKHSGRNFKGKVLEFVFLNNLRCSSSKENDKRNCSRQGVS